MRSFRTKIFLVRCSLVLATVVALLLSSGCKTPLHIEDWQVISMGGTPIGYVHTVTRERAEPEPAIVSTAFGHTRITRLGFVMEIRTTTEYVETLDGELRSVVSETHTASTKSRSKATVKGIVVEIEKTIAGKTFKSEVKCEEQLFGPYGQTQQTLRTALFEGGSLEYSTFVPELGSVSTSTVSIDGRRELMHGGETLSLWHGTVAQDILPGITTEVWMDDEGNLIRSLTPTMGGLETRRSSEFEALRAVAPSRNVDIMKRFFVPCSTEIIRPYRTKEILFELEAPDAVLSQLQLKDRRQTIEEESAGKVLLRVRAVGDADAPAAEKPAKEFLVPTPYLQSDDPEIIALAHEAARDAATPHEKALNLREWVYDHVKTKDFSIGFASAKEVAASRRGDCTEHAVLLAAMLRAEEIPSRVAVGVVYYRGQFAYHMWTEAFLNDWTAFDSSLGQEIVDATHIKFTDAALTDTSATMPLLKMTGIIGNLKITVKEVK